MLMVILFIALYIVAQFGCGYILTKLNTESGAYDTVEFRRQQSAAMEFVTGHIGMFEYISRVIGIKAMCQYYIAVARISVALAIFNFVFNTIFLPGIMLVFILSIPVAYISRRQYRQAELDATPLWPYN